jgi:hypothetical protein
LLQDVKGGGQNRYFPLYSTTGVRLPAVEARCLFLLLYILSARRERKTSFPCGFSAFSGRRADCALSGGEAAVVSNDRIKKKCPTKEGLISSEFLVFTTNLNFQA